MKEIYAMILSNSYDFKGNVPNLNNFKNIVVTFGSDSSVKNNLYFDKYFNFSSKDKSTLWIVVFSGKKEIYNDNVICIVQKKTNLLKKIYNFIIFIFHLSFKKKIYIILLIIISHQ